MSHDTNWDNLSTFVSTIMQEKGVPGVAVGILHQGQTATAGFGVTNLDHPLAVTDETLFQIGSITKTFTGSALMRLVEMGKVDLDATVRTYIPEFKVVDETASSQATVRHLLTHMSGWVGDFFIDTGMGEDAIAKYVARMAELGQLAPIGSVWSYNNAGFTLAGHIMERVTGKDYGALLKEFVLEPIGMNGSYLNPGDILTYRFAVGHSVGEEGPKVARPWPVPRKSWPSGGIICHVKDLLRYARFHLGDGSTEDGERLLTHETLSQMQTPQVTIWETQSWGLSWELDEVAGKRLVSHGGSTVGQMAALAMIPEHDFAIAILTNSDRGREVTHEVSRQAFKVYLGLDEADPEPIEATEADYAPYVGRYSRPFADIELDIQGGTLIGRKTIKQGYPAADTPARPSPPPFELVLCEPDRLLITDGALKNNKVDIVRNDDGSIGWIREGRRIYPRQA